MRAVLFVPADSGAGLPIDDATNGTAPVTVLGALCGQLRSLGVRHVTVLTDAPATGGYAAVADRAARCGTLADALRVVADEAGAAGEPLVFGRGDLVAHEEALARLLAVPGDATAALVAAPATDRTAGDAPPVRVSDRRIESAGSGYHRVTAATGTFRQLMRVSEADAPRLVAAAEQLIDLASPPRDPGGLPDTAALLLVALVRGGLDVTPRDLGPLRCATARDDAGITAARAELAGVDADRVRLDEAVKGDDGLFTTYCVSSYSRFIARWAARHGIAPNTVTYVNLALAVLAGLGFASGHRLGAVLGAVALYFAFVLDCVDGQIARYGRSYSKLGAWLDATGDRAKEYIAYAGLAIGSLRAGAGDVWSLAIAAMALQTVRHMVDFSFAAVHAEWVPPLPVHPVGAVDDGAVPAAHPAAPRAATTGPGGGSPGRGSVLRRLAGGAAELSTRTEHTRPLHWAKKVVILPIGERFALIAVTAALFQPRVTFIALLVWGGLAGCYTLTGRVLRSLTRRGSP